MLLYVTERCSSPYPPAGAESTAQVCERIMIFNDGGGFLFNATHNVKANTPRANIQAMFVALADSRRGGPTA